MTSLNDRDFIASIRRFWDFLSLIGLEETFSNPTSLKASDEFLAVIFDSSASYEAVYLTALRNSDYNLMLRDHSFFQFTHSLSGWRLAYYPNPFFGASDAALSEVSELRDYVKEGAISIEEFLHRLSELRSAIQAPLLRYEWAPNDYINLQHPASHMHVGFHSDNRWAFTRVLSPEAFGMFVIKLYYRSSWNPDFRCLVGRDERSLDQIYSACRASTILVPADRISAEELAQFHLA